METDNQHRFVRIPLLITSLCVMSVQVVLCQSGNVGIGTPDPLSLLHLKSTVAGDSTGLRLSIGGIQNSYLYNTGTDLIIRNKMNTHQLVLDQNGNIGIGTDAPVAGLHIINSNQAIRLDGLSPSLQFYDGTIQKGYLQQSVSNLTLSNSLAGKLIFATNGTTQMTIDSSGKVGINVSSAEAQLHVKQNGEAIRIEGNNAMLGLYQGATQKGALGHLSGEMYLINVDSARLNLGTNNNTHLTIAANGNVGVGTQTPGSTMQLHSTQQGDITGLRISTPGHNARIYMNNNDLVLRKGSNANQLVLDEFGDIGIGINDPVDDLHVKGSNGYIRMDGPEPGLTFFNNNDWLGSIQTLNSNLRIQNRKVGKTFLGNDGLIQVTVDSDGKVGLGTQIPEAKLQLYSATEDEISGIRLSAMSNTQNSVIYNKNGNMNLGIQGINKHLVLTPVGGVGIGTDIPDALFHVNSGSSPYAGIFQNSASPGTWLGIGNVSAGGKFFHLISSGSENTGGAGNLLIYSGDVWDQASNLAIAVNGSDGRVAVGTLEFGTGYELSVGGKIISEGLRVQAIGSWPDYVFEPDYNRPVLSEVEAFINTHGHLPGFDPASIVEAQGLDMEVITVQQQEWIEISTLYILEQEKRIEALERQVEQQSQQIELLLNQTGNK